MEEADYLNLIHAMALAKFVLYTLKHLLVSTQSEITTAFNSDLDGLS